MHTELLVLALTGRMATLTPAQVHCYHNLRALMLLLDEDGKHPCDWITWQDTCTFGFKLKLVQVRAESDDNKPDVELTTLGCEVVKLINPQLWQWRSLSNIAVTEVAQSSFQIEQPGVRDPIGLIYVQADVELMVRLLNAHEAKQARTYING
jgi:hypothetical protein